MEDRSYMEEVMQSKYADQMEDVKRRTEVINAVISGQFDALYKAITVELVYLQFRKTLELIAMASLVANRAAMEQLYSPRKLGRYWNADDLLRDIGKINPNFYPHPVIEVPSQDPQVKSDLQDRVGDFLSKDDFRHLYNKVCGTLMHTANPFGKAIDYDGLITEIPAWLTKIINLLNCHRIKLVNDERIYLIHMREERDDKVHVYTFERLEDGLQAL